MGHQVSSSDVCIRVSHFLELSDEAPVEGSQSYGFNPTWRPRGLSKSVISRVSIRATPFRVLLTLLIAQLPSFLGLQVGSLLGLLKEIYKGFNPIMRLQVCNYGRRSRLGAEGRCTETF